MSSNGAPETQRLFFALWPERALQENWARLTRRALKKRGKRIRLENLHLTLVFLGGMTAPQRACAEAAADRVTGSAFELRMERIGHWPRPRVVWLAPPATPESLRDLVRQLNEGLTACGHRPDPRPYRAHLTLARKVAGYFPDRQVAPSLWSVKQFCLVQSVTHPAGAEYRILRRWPLARQSVDCG